MFAYGQSYSQKMSRIFLETLYFINMLTYILQTSKCSRTFVIQANLAKFHKVFIHADYFLH